MQKLVLGTLALAAMMAGPAMAADQKVKAMLTKAPPPPAVFSWTGLYIGASGGGAWGRDSVTHAPLAAAPGLAFPIDAAAVTAASSPSLSPNGGIAGGHAGYNYQTGKLVLGLEGDVSWFRLRQNSTGTFPFPSTLPGGPLGPPTLTFTANTTVSTDWLITLRPRLGIAVDNNWLLYATGGLAVTQYNLNQVSGVLNSATFASSISGTRTGWAIGAGIEHAMTKNWRLRAEYLHLDFGTATGGGTSNAPAGVLGNLLCTPGSPVLTGPFTLGGCAISSRLTAEVFRAGISYALDTSPAVVTTKY
jgi:outer membrane immunogenic protein